MTVTVPGSDSDCPTVTVTVRRRPRPGLAGGLLPGGASHRDGASHGDSELRLVTRDYAIDSGSLSASQWHRRLRVGSD